jgi:hypothetical protein
MEMIKVNDNRVRIVTKGPKDMDTQINVDEEVDEVDPFDNKIKVSIFCVAYTIRPALTVPATTPKNINKSHLRGTCIMNSVLITRCGK